MLSFLFASSLLETDTLKNFDIEEAVVVASPKETKQFRKQPISVSLFDAKALSSHRIENVKDLSAYAPNFFMPAYGSRLTSALYVRGIGSRINTPAVGLYVDNVPYTDKTAYDFSFQGVERVDVLRGPQGTLYGRNTMGGLVRVFTANPLTHYGTDVCVGLGSALKEESTLSRHAAFTTFIHPTERMAWSVGGYYDGKNGYFTNEATNKKQDASEAAGGRVRMSYQPTDVVKIDWTTSYEYSKEKACPYFLLGKTTEFKDGFHTANDDTLWRTISQNRPSTYRRNLFNTGLGVEHRLSRMVLTSITAYQNLSDRLFMDQDFSSADIFSLCQKQNINTLSEEIALKNASSSKSRWTWTTGAFFMYQWLQTQCPVTFYAEGVDYLNRQIGANLPARPSIDIAFTGKEIPFASQLKTPSLNAALYHQSNVRLFGGLSATLGLRLDYDNQRLNLSSDAGQTGVPYHFGMNMGPTMNFQTDLNADPSLYGKLTHNNWQVLPKAALNYALPRELGNVYVSVTKGYRSGGYNIQSYSDLAQTQLRRQMMLGVKEYSIQSINSLPLPDAVKNAAITGMTTSLDEITPSQPDIETLYYKPEYTWSYEAGIHHNLADKTLQLDLAAFYMKTRNQQIARFSESGMGRVMVNAGRSRSCGVEVGVRSQLMAERLDLALNYGFTSAVFTNYNMGKSSATGAEVDYTNNRVPYVPKHTFSASFSYRQPCNGLVRALSAGADVKGAGNIVWDEANTFSQRFYATLALRVGIELKHQLSLNVWAQNVTNTRYATFAFDSMNNRFAQYAAPRTIGLDVKWHF